MKNLLLLIVAGAFFIALNPCQAEIPHLINYQGMLTQTDGTPLDGSYDLTFKIYGSESGVDSLWWEHHTDVIVTDGFFNVLLGSISSLSVSVFEDSNRYLSIKVGDDPELTPRIRLTSVGYAYRASVADSAMVSPPPSTGGGWTDDGASVRLTTGTDKVGIGTASPEYELDVRGKRIQLKEDGTNDWIAMRTDGDALDFQFEGGTLYVQSTTDGEHILLNPNRNSNVGIGTTIPLQKLHVAGTAQMNGFKMSTGATNGYVLTSDASGVGTWQAASGGGIGGSGTANYISKFTASTTLGNSAIYETGGKVGIGLTNPYKKLHLSENAALSYPLKLDNPNTNVGSGPGILFSAGGDGSTRGKGGLIYRCTTTWNRGSFHFLQDANANTDNPTFSDEVMTITNDGKVGIGTTTPLSQLDVRGDRMRLEEDATGDWIAMRTDGGALDLSFGGGHLYMQSETVGEHIFLNPSTNNNVGVGTITPDAKLHAKSSTNTAIKGESTDPAGFGVRGSGKAAGAYFLDSDASGYAYVANGDKGITAYGDDAGGYFKDTNNDSCYAYVAKNGVGIDARGFVYGAYFRDVEQGAYAYVAFSTHKILGSGSVDFVQNHPVQRDKVIVYAAPEGDEVATYTRGTARLVNGEVRVTLGETFEWVTNPDIGLTAHLTPRGDCKGLYVASLTSKELVVRELQSGTSNVTFDYIVYGLRIGFEEVGIVQEKQIESYIPSMAEHRELYEKYPELRRYNALERFKLMNAEIGNTELNLSASKALHDAVIEFDPKIHNLPQQEVNE